MKILLLEDDAALGAAVALGHCWDKLHDSSSNIADAMINNLRTCIGTPEVIHTVRGAVHRPTP